ncbi:hypothetical protein [Paenibacillus arenilitoris]|uniref:Uncharacterized protein n=1 Tax=Paenibacillus arenilitoris TaxID=2772299 RepID=A0A927CPI5_9BACL|nr:hypothetical protein [Paenibacillus arenilitoris]MBD2871344.1 hypothetical protein [Paenibacillus arenilitoris]
MRNAEAVTAVFIILISLPICLVAFLVIRQSFQPNREIKQILKNGVPKEATIASIRQTDTEINGHPEVFIGLSIAREHGEPLRTIIKTAIQMVHIPKYQPGRKVRVKVLEIDGKIKVALEDASTIS